MSLLTTNMIGFLVTMIPFVALAVWIIYKEAQPGNHHLHMW